VTEQADVAVVTGASRGLGRGIAVSLARSGFDIVINYSASEPEAKQTARLVEDAGRRTAIVGGDVVDSATHGALVAAALELGRLRAWINNAGVSMLAPVLDTDVAALRHMLDVNVVGLFHGMQAAAHVMRTAGGGRIVNIASELGVQAVPYLGGYAATKFAVVGLTQAAALELAADGVTVNAVCPGTAETDMVAAERNAQTVLTGATAQQLRLSYLDAIPAARFCEPSDVGELVAYLASPAASYLTGQAICINGGSVLR
jgi:NAD(P)-dependent dehydrogenase (short-subunit alcohol dehydrogenase family)